MILKDILTTVIIHYNTPVLLEKAVESFHHTYPEVNLLLIDNGSDNEGKKKVEYLADKFSCCQSYFLDENIYHGPAMDLAMGFISSKFVFFLDSDTVTNKTGFLESMAQQLFNDHNVYGSGKVVYINKRGFVDQKGIPVLATPYMLLKRSIYEELDPFIHHGTPTIENFTSCFDQNYKLENFPVDEYIHHIGRGTVDKFGYGLGLRGKINFILNKFGF